MATTNAAERVRERIRHWLDMAGVTQKEFAGHFGRSQEWLQKILSGDNDLRLQDLDALGNIMHMTPSELVKEENSERFEMDLTPTEVRLIERIRLRPKTLDALVEMMGLYPSNNLHKSTAPSIKNRDGRARP